MAGSLYIVATPIGNLEDITLRALSVLKKVDLIAAEDTRHTQTLLRHYDIRTPLISYHEHNEKSKAALLLERLLGGENIALVSDAGTPAISDPGYRLIVAAVGAGIQVTPLPGASALATVLSASGLPTDRFVFEGFLPAKKQERRAKLEALRAEARTLIFYEAPHRVPETLTDMQQILGERQIVIGREVSKLHEEFLRGTIGDVLARIAEQTVKGEITIVVHGAAKESPVSVEILKTEIRKFVATGMRIKQVSEMIGERYGISKREVYKLALALKDAE